MIAHHEARTYRFGRGQYGGDQTFKAFQLAKQKAREFFDAVKELSPSSLCELLDSVEFAGLFQELAGATIWTTTSKGNILPLNEEEDENLAENDLGTDFTPHRSVAATVMELFSHEKINLGTANKIAEKMRDELALQQDEGASPDDIRAAIDTASEVYADTLLCILASREFANQDPATETDAFLWTTVENLASTLTESPFRNDKLAKKIARYFRSSVSDTSLSRADLDEYEETIRKIVTEMLAGRVDAGDDDEDEDDDEEKEEEEEEDYDEDEEEEEEDDE